MRYTVHREHVYLCLVKIYALNQSARVLTLNIGVLTLKAGVLTVKLAFTNGFFEAFCLCGGGD